MSTVEIDITANTKQAKDAIKNLSKDVDNLDKKSLTAGAKVSRKTSKQSSVGTQDVKGIGNVKTALSGVSDTLGRLSPRINDAIGGITDIFSKIEGFVGGRLAGMLTGVGAGGVAAAGALALPAVAMGGLLANASSQVDNGRARFEDFERLNASFSTLIKNLTGARIGADQLASTVQDIATVGVVPIDELKEGANRLLLAFKGNVSEASKWIRILADISAGTGESVSSLSELITRAKQFGTVDDFEVINQLNEKGIPVIEALNGKFGETREEIEKAFKDGKVAADDFIKSLEKAYELTLRGSNAAQGQVTLTQLQGREQALKQQESANYTAGYDAVKAQQVQERIDYQQSRNDDISISTTAIGAGRALANLSNIVDDVTFGFSKLSNTVIDYAGRLLDWDDSGAMQQIDNINNDWESGIANIGRLPQDDITSAQLANLITQGQDYAKTLQSIANGDNFEDVTRSSASNTLDVVNRQIAELQKIQNEAIKREKEAAEKAAQEQREKTANENRRQYNEQEALKNNDVEGYLAANGTNRKQLMDDIATNRDIITAGNDYDGKATDTLKKLTEILDNVLKMEDALNEKAKSASEDLQKDKDRKYKMESERVANRMIYEREYKYNPLQRKVLSSLVDNSVFFKNFDPNETKIVSRRMTDGEIPYEEALQRIRAKERDLDSNTTLSQKDKELILKDYINSEKLKLNDMVATQQRKVQEEQARVNNAKDTGMLMATNAWGSTGNVYSNFNQAVKIDSQQFKVWQELVAVSEKYMTAIATYTPVAQ